MENDLLCKPMCNEARCKIPVFKNIYFLLNVFECFACMYKYYEHIFCSKRQEEGIRVPGV